MPQPAGSLAGSCRTGPSRRGRCRRLACQLTGREMGASTRRRRKAGSESVRSLRSPLTSARSLRSRWPGAVMPAFPLASRALLTTHPHSTRTAHGRAPTCHREPMAAPGADRSRPPLRSGREVRPGSASGSDRSSAPGTSPPARRQKRLGCRRSVELDHNASATTVFFLAALPLHRPCPPARPPTLPLTAPRARVRPRPRTERPSCHDLPLPLPHDRLPAITARPPRACMPLSTSSRPYRRQQRQPPGTRSRCRQSAGTVPQAAAAVRLAGCLATLAAHRAAHQAGRPLPSLLIQLPAPDRSAGRLRPAVPASTCWTQDRSAGSMPECAGSLPAGR